MSDSKLPQHLKDLIQDGLLSVDGVIHYPEGSNPDEVNAEILRRLEEVDVSTLSSKQRYWHDKILHRVRKQIGEKKGRTVTKPAPNEPITRAEFTAAYTNLVEYVNDQIKQIVEAHNRLVERVAYAIHLGEVVTQTLIDKGVLTEDELMVKLEEAIEQTKKAMMESSQSESSAFADQTTNSTTAEEEQTNEP